MKKGTEDIVSSDRRSIRDIPLPKRASTSVPDAKPLFTEAPRQTGAPRQMREDIVSERLDRTVRDPLKRTSNNAPQTRSKGVWFIAVLSIVAVAVCATWILSKTTVNLNIKKITMSANGVYVAASTPTEGVSFSFDTIELTAEETKTVDATGSKEVSTKATGTVIIFNNYNATAQALVAGTRLEDPNGMIFKINNAVTVPGKKTVAGKATPGSVEVKVTAESAGEKYNIALSDFIIPGFKDTPKFNGFYARSKSAMTGGMNGTVAVVSDEQLKSAREELNAALLPAVIAKVRAELPKDFVFLEGAYKTSFKSSEPTAAAGNKAVIKEEVTIKGFVFKQDDFVKALASEAKVPLILNAPIVLDHSSVKVLSIEENSPKAFFKLEGTLRGEYAVDESAIKKALRGQKKKEVPKILTSFPIIEKAQVIVSPFWIGSLPGSEGKIEIVKQ